MPFPALILPLLAAAVAAEKPITVVGQPWAPFISPMGEPFRSRAPGDDTLADWFRQADRNHDGFLTLDEMKADADRFFAKLDTNHDGQIDPDELVAYEWELAPEIQVNSRARRARGEPPPKVDKRAEERRDDIDDDAATKGWTRGREREANLGPQGAARYALINMPEPVAAADADFNRVVTLEEFRQAAAERFAILDTKHQGRLDLEGLRALLPPSPALAKHQKPAKDKNDTRVGSGLPPVGSAPDDH